MTTEAPTTPTTSSQSKPRIRHIAQSRYLVESFSRPGIGHQVDVLRLKCGCEAGSYGRRCKHLVLAIQYDAWRMREQTRAAGARKAERTVTTKGTGASAQSAPAPAPVPHAPAGEGDWHTSAAYRALAQAFGE